MKNIRDDNTYYSIPLEDLSIKEIAFDAFISVVKKNITFHDNATYSLRKVFINEIYPLTKFVYDYRLDIAKEFIKKYEWAEVERFRPVRAFNSKVYQIIAPPICEIHSGKLVLCDGMHRVFSIRESLQEIMVLVIEGTKIPLPGNINNWNKVRVLQKEVSLRENFINFSSENLTGYTKIFNSDLMWGNSY